MSGGAMNAERLLEVYEQISEAPDAITRLRRFVLDLAVRGKLVEQDPGDEPAIQLLDRIAKEKARLLKVGAIKKKPDLPPVARCDQPHLLPSNWIWVRFANIVDFSAGRTPSRNDTSYWNTGDFHWVSIADMVDGEILIETKETVSEKAKKHAFKSDPAPPGTMIMSFKLTIGKMSRLGVHAYHNEAIISIRPHLAELDPYLFKVLPDLARGGETKGAIKGATLNRESISNILIPLPPLAEQHRIVAKVDELMALCDRLEEVRKTREEVRDKLTAASLARLTAPDTTAEDFPPHAAFALEALPALTTRPDQIKTLRQTILNLAVRGNLVKQDPAEGVTEPEAATALGKEPFEIPKSWSWQLFGSLADMINGDRSKNYPNRNEYQPSGVAWINTGHIQPDGSLDLPGMHYISREKFDTLRSGKVQPGDLVYCLRGATLGKTGFVEPFEEGAIASSLMIIRLRPEMDRKFAYNLLMSPYGKEQLLRFDNGTAQPNLSAGNVRKYLIPLPPLAEQHRIVAKVDALMALCDRLEAALTTTDTTRTRLLEALLNEALEPAAQAVTEAAE